MGISSDACGSPFSVDTMIARNVSSFTASLLL